MKRPITPEPQPAPPPTVRATARTDTFYQGQLYRAGSVVEIPAEVAAAAEQQGTPESRQFITPQQQELQEALAAAVEHQQQERRAEESTSFMTRVREQAADRVRRRLAEAERAEAEGQRLLGEARRMREALARDNDNAVTPSAA